MIEFDPGWRFLDYLEGGENPIEDWYQALSGDGRDIFDAVLKVNSKATLPLHWSDCKMLHGEARKHGIWE